MIKSVGQMIGSPVELGKSRESGKAKAASSVESTAAGAADAPSTPAARMAAQGAPVDLDRVAAIKSAIAAGNYPVDAKLIAEKMIALDMPGEH